MNLFRSEAMSAIGGAEHLPDLWRIWDQGPSTATLRTDFDFYMTEQVPVEFQADLEGVLNMFQVPRQRTPLELIARFYTRFSQIVGLFDERDLLSLKHSWSVNKHIALGHVGIIEKIHPVP